MSGFSSAEATILQALIQVQQELGEVKQELTHLRQLEGLPDQLRLCPRPVRLVKIRPQATSQQWSVAAES